MNIVLHTPPGFSAEQSKQIEKTASELLYEFRNLAPEPRVAELSVRMRDFCQRLMPWVQPRIGALTYFDKEPTVHLIIVKI